MEAQDCARLPRPCDNRRLMSSEGKRLLKNPPVTKQPRVATPPSAPILTSPTLSRVLAGQLLAIARSPVSSYVAILLLQLRVVWGIWWYKDLNGGDTAMYFENAAEWFRQGRIMLAQSPLYTFFYGTFLNFLDDSYAITILHRLVIVFILAVLVLALMRQLLPPALHGWQRRGGWCSPSITTPFMKSTSSR